MGYQGALSLLLVFSLNSHASEPATTAAQAASNSTVTNSSSVPNGTHLKLVSPDCEPRRVEERILREAKTSQDMYKLLNGYFKNCGDELSNTQAKGLLGLLAFGRQEYNVYDNPNIKHITMKLDDGTISLGVLGLKPDSKPRPMIVFRCGVTCDASTGSIIKNYMMDLFDQTPFHLLIVGSRTGTDFLKANGVVSIGGYEEGYEMIQVAKWLRANPDLNAKISSLHMMGASLGGNASLMGALYNEKFRDGEGKPYFNSIAAICPAADLQNTMTALMAKSLVGGIFYDEFVSTLKDAKPFLKDVPDLIPDSKFPSMSEMPNFMGMVATTSLQRRGLASLTQEKFWENNNFFAQNLSTTTPILAFASKDDDVVKNSINTGRIEAGDPVKDLHKNLGTLNVPFGNHCGFNSVYGGPAVSMVLRSFVLMNSPEFKDQYTRTKISFPISFRTLTGGDLHGKQEWKFFANSSRVNLRFKVLSPIFAELDERCPKNGNPWNMPDRCVIDNDVTLDVNDLAQFGVTIPRTQGEAEAMTREFNTRAELWTGTLPTTGQTKPPTHLVLRPK